MDLIKNSTVCDNLIVFLDVDGVLNSVDSAIAFHHLKNEIEYHSRESQLDTVSIGLLKAVCEKTQAKIVVSSTWRIGRTVQDFTDLFATYGWDDAPVIGKTEILRHAGRIRGDEIQMWLDEHAPTNYVIIDDDSDMRPSQKANFVHVSNVNGFRSKHYCQCLRVLGFEDLILENTVNWVRPTDISS